MTTKVTLSSKNQIVVPKEARGKLNIGPGQEMLELVNVPPAAVHLYHPVPAACAESLQDQWHQRDMR